MQLLRNYVGSDLGAESVQSTVDQVLSLAVVGP